MRNILFLWRFGDKMKKLSGMILLSTLIFLQIITLLTLCVMQIAFKEARSAHAISIRHTLLKNTENALIYLEGTLPGLTECHISPASSAILAARPLEWWQSLTACKGQLDDTEYYYVIESLGADNCAVLQTYPNYLVAHYHRITVLARLYQSQIMLQTTAATASRLAEGQTCHGEIRMIQQGRKMWREVQ